MRRIDADMLRDHLYAQFRTAEQVPGLEIDERLILLTIDNAPTIDAELVRHGRWIPNSPFTGNCSECGGDGNLKQRNCGDCGAKMDAPSDATEEVTP